MTTPHYLGPEILLFFCVASLSILQEKLENVVFVYLLKLRILQKYQGFVNKKEV